jgi:hypothetical protein
VPITYAVEPSLLHSVEAMTRPYSVLQDGAAVEQPPSAAAEAWLTALREAAQDSEVLALPFGDPDVVAISRADSGLRAQVEPLRRLGESEVARLLGVEPLPSVAWPPPGPLPAALDVVVGGQARAVVLDSSALPPASGSRSRTPSARSQLPSVTGPVSGLVAEPVLSALLEPPGTDPQAGEEPAPGAGSRLAEQRWIAETAIIAAETPSTSRTLLVAPRRLADVDPEVVREVIADTGRLPWLCPVPLADVAAGQERCAELPDDQGPAEAELPAPPSATTSATQPPADGAGAGLSPAFLTRLASVSRAADQFTEAILVPGSEQAAGTRARLLRATGRAASAAWREQPLQGREMLRLLQQDVTALRGKVRLVSGPITLTGSSGTLPLLVQNELDQPVTVGVVLDETSAARLSLSTSGAQVVPARELYERISVQVEPRTSGRFVVLATLVDAQGRRFGEAVPLQVRSTGYGGLALTVTWVAAAVLLLATGTRLVRRAAAPARGRTRHPGVTGLGRSTRAMAGRDDRLARHRAAAQRRAGRGPGPRDRRRGVHRRQHRPEHRLRAAARRGAHLRGGAAAGARRQGGRRRGPGVRAAAAHPGRPRARERVAAAGAGRAVGRRPLLRRPQPRGPGAGDGVRPVLPAAGALLRHRRGARRGAEHPRPVRPADVGAGPEQPRRHRHRLAFLAVRGRGALTPESLTPGQLALLGIGTTLGIVAQTVALVPALRAAGFSLRPRWDFRALGLRRVASLAQWVLLFVVANQVAYLVVVNLSTADDLVQAGRGYPSYVYAFLLFSLPHAVVAVSVITALLPRMSRAAADGRTDELRASLNRGLRLTVAVLVPAAVAFVVLGRELAVLVFARAEVSVADARFIGALLGVFAVGLVPFSCYQLQLRAFYAMQDTRTPTLINFVVNATLVGVGTLLYVLLPDPYEVLGLAAGHASSFLAGLAVCSAVLSRRLGGLDLSLVVRTAVRCLLAAAAPGLLALAVAAVVERELGRGPLGAVVSLALGGGVLGIGYLLATRRLGVPEVDEVAGPVLRRVGLG